MHKEQKGEAGGEGALVWGRSSLSGSVEQGLTRSVAVAEAVRVLPANSPPRPPRSLLRLIMCTRINRVFRPKLLRCNARCAWA